MSTRANHAAIGFFVLGALLIIAVGLAVFFGGGWGREKNPVLMVFEGNVAGIEVGTPVEFRGVRVGEVKRIRSLYDTTTKKLRFAVYAELTGRIEVDGGRTPQTSQAQRKIWVDDMVTQGLRARLETKSYVTGQQRVMLDFLADTKAELSGLEPQMIEIPTALSPGEEIVAGLREIPFREIIVEGRRALTSINRMMATDDGKPGPVPQLLADLSRLSRDIDERVPQLATEAVAVTRQARVALADVRTLVDETKGAVGLIAEAVKTLERRVDGSGSAFDATAAQLRALATRLEAPIARIDGLIGTADTALQQVTGTLRNVDGSLGKVDGAIAKADGAIGKVDGAIAKADGAIGKADSAISRIDSTLVQMGSTLRRVDHTLSEDAPLAASIGETMRELGAAAQALRATAELLQRRPESLLRGRGEAR